MRSTWLQKLGRDHGLDARGRFSGEPPDGAFLDRPLGLRVRDQLRRCATQVGLVADDDHDAAVLLRRFHDRGDRCARRQRLFRKRCCERRRRLLCARCGARKQRVLAWKVRAEPLRHRLSLLLALRREAPRHVVGAVFGICVPPEDELHAA